jgi:hypothetical protein
MCELWKLGSVAMYHPTYQTQHCSLFIIYGRCKRYVLLWLHLSFSPPTLGGRWTILWITHPPCRRVAGSITDGSLCRSCPVVLWSVIHHWLSFSEHRQVWSPLKHSHCPFHFGLCCIFFNVELLRLATCSKERKFLGPFCSFSARWIIVYHSVCTAHTLQNLLKSSVASGFTFSFFSPNPPHLSLSLSLLIGGLK